MDKPKDSSAERILEVTPEDHKFIITVVLGTAGLQLTITTAFLGLLVHSLTTRISSLENRMLSLEKSMKDFQDEIRTKIDLLVGKN